MFWSIVGWSITLSSGLLLLHKIQNSLKKKFPWITDEHIAYIKFWLISFGVLISVISFFVSRSTYKVFEYDLYRIKDFDISISLSTNLNIVPEFYGNGNLHTRVDPNENIPSEIPGKYIGRSCFDCSDSNSLSYLYETDNKINNNAGGVFMVNAYKKSGENFKFPLTNGKLIEYILDIKIIDIESLFFINKKELDKIKGFWMSFIVNGINIKSHFIKEDRYRDLIFLKEGYSGEVPSFKLRIEMSEVFKNAEEIRRSYRKNLSQLEVKRRNL